MKRIILLALAGLMAVAPAPAQSRKVVKQAKEDARLLARQFKTDGYKALDNVKLEDAITDYLSDKYSDKSLFEVVGKATEKNLNEGKARARQEALSVYPTAAVRNSFFIYKKNRRKYDVICYALIGGGTSRGYSTSSSGGFNRLDQEVKEARQEAKKEARQEQKEIKKAQAKAQKKAEQARKKADKAHQKAVDKATEKARKAIDKADREREKALEGINY